jgi:hypothetical protein
MNLRTFLVVLCAATFLPLGAAHAERPANTRQAPAPTRGEVVEHRLQQSSAQERSKDADGDRYAEREKENLELQQFKGGDKTVISISAGTLIIILLIIIIL